jgi:hypothetical protein
MFITRVLGEEKKSSEEDFFSSMVLGLAVSFA